MSVPRTKHVSKSKTDSRFTSAFHKCIFHKHTREHTRDVFLTSILLFLETGYLADLGELRVRKWEWEWGVEMGEGRWGM